MLIARKLKMLLLACCVIAAMPTTGAKSESKADSEEEAEDESAPDHWAANPGTNLAGSGVRK
jgi:hypothetical protein